MNNIVAFSHFKNKQHSVHRTHIGQSILYQSLSSELYSLSIENVHE